MKHRPRHPGGHVAVDPQFGRHLVHEAVAFGGVLFKIHGAHRTTYIIPAVPAPAIAPVPRSFKRLIVPEHGLDWLLLIKHFNRTFTCLID
jgi:hypothetical protein